MKFQKIAIIGVGLLGGSVGLAVRQRGLAREVAGYVRRPAGLADCEKAGALDYATTDLLAAVSGAELAILCTPLSQMASVTTQMLPALKAGAVVTDVGSVKASVVRDLEKLVTKAGGHFVAGHPMAGGEKSGVLAARADLFVNAVCILTPTKNTHQPSLRALEQFWRGLGSRILLQTPGEHDALVSQSSHLPHVIAATLASQVLAPRQVAAVSPMCATGFRDTTRVATGSAEMWRDIALANRKNLGQSMKGFIAELGKFQKALAKGDGKKVEHFFAEAKRRREEWEVGGKTSKSKIQTPEKLQ